jgi:aldose 1-epimerase
MILRLAADGATTDVDPVAGGRLTSLVVGGRERLITREDPSAVLPPISWGSFVMVPWVGRIRNGRLSWRGTSADLPANFGPHAIHGAVFDAEWDVLERGDATAVLHCRLGPSRRWPFDAWAQQTIALRPGVLEQRVEVRAAEPMPAAVGWHPWFRRYEGEPMSVLVPAQAILGTTEGPIPTGAVVPVGGDTDLRDGPELGDRRLDHAFVALDGPCLVTWADLELTIEAEPLRSVVVYTPPTAVCVEPQSAWPDAVRLHAGGLDTGLVEMNPDDPFVAATRWSWRTVEAGGRAG